MDIAKVHNCLLSQTIDTPKSFTNGRVDRRLTDSLMKSATCPIVGWLSKGKYQQNELIDNTLEKVLVESNKVSEMGQSIARYIGPLLC